MLLLGYYHFRLPKSRIIPQYLRLMTYYHVVAMRQFSGIFLCLLSKHRGTMISPSAKIHPLAYIEDNVSIGDNTVIGPFCIVRSGARIGSDCKFTAYCEIREDVTIGDRTGFGSRCTISAGATIGSDVSIKYSFVLTDTPNLKEGYIKSVGNIGDGALIGANVTLMPGFSIGANSVIGACSQVRDNVGAGEVWFGSPAKLFKKND